MKRIISGILILTLLCTAYMNKDSINNKNVKETNSIENKKTSNEEFETNTIINNKESIELTETKYSGLNDPQLLNDIKDKVYKEIVKQVHDENMIIEDIKTVYISQDYIDELTFNSKPNIYFGYTLEEVENAFDGKKYIFTVSDDGKTIVKEFEKYDDTTDKIIKNVAIGTGVILITVTVSFATASTAPAISLILATSAKSGAIMAVSSGSIGAVSAGLITGIKTKDMNKALKQAALSGSEGFKIGAISGEILGGIQKFNELKNLSNISKELADEANLLSNTTKYKPMTMDEIASIQRESKYPFELIKHIKTWDEYIVYKNAGCYPKEIAGKLSLVQDIDLSVTSEFGGKIVTNLERMKLGGSPVFYENGKEFTYQLHHINQDPNGLLAVLKGTEHQGNASILNILGKEGVDHGYEWTKTVKQFWKSYAAIIE